MKFRGAKNGRAKAIGLIDQLCSKEDNLEKLRVVLQLEFTRDPMKFFKTIIMPLAPREFESLDDSVWAKMTPSQVCAMMDKKTVGDVDEAKEDETKNC